MAQRDEASVSASADAGVSGIPAELAEARATIDNIDAALVHILAERFRCTQRVGHIKARLDLPPADPDREPARSSACAPWRLPPASPRFCREVPGLHGPRGHPPPRGHQGRVRRGLVPLKRTLGECQAPASSVVRPTDAALIPLSEL